MYVARRVCSTLQRVRATPSVVRSTRAGSPARTHPRGSSCSDVGWRPVRERCQRRPDESSRYSTGHPDSLAEPESTSASNELAPRSGNNTRRKVNAISGDEAKPVLEAVKTKVSEPEKLLDEQPSTSLGRQPGSRTTVQRLGSEAALQPRACKRRHRAPHNTHRSSPRAPGIRVPIRPRSRTSRSRRSGIPRRGIPGRAFGDTCSAGTRVFRGSHTAPPAGKYACVVDTGCDFCRDDQDRSLRSCWGQMWMVATTDRAVRDEAAKHERARRRGVVARLSANGRLCRVRSATIARSSGWCTTHRRECRSARFAPGELLVAGAARPAG
jgi:hypothetical protein